MKTPITKRFAIAKKLADFSWHIHRTETGEYYCILESFYDYFRHEWHSGNYMSEIACDNWALSKIQEAGFVPINNEKGKPFDEYKED